MADGTIAVVESGTPTKLLDTTSLTVSAQTVQRERMQIAGAGATELAAVKAASTAAAAADPALVVALSPNNSVGNAQGSTTAGQIGPLIQATATAFPPTGIGAGKTGPLSMDQGGGALRVGMNVVTDAGNVLGTPWILQPEITEDFAIRTSVGNVLDWEAMNHTAQNTAKHRVDATTMTVTQTSAGFTTNGGSITTINTGVAFSTYQHFPIPEGAVNYYFMKFKFTGTPAATNTTIDWGPFLRPTSTPYAPTDGVYFRNTSSGMFGVTNFNGTETLTSAFKVAAGGANFVPTAGTEYDGIIYHFNQVAVFWLDMRDGNGYTMMGRVNSTSSAGKTTLAQSAPLSVRHAIGGSAASAAVSFVLVSYQVTQDGLPLNRPWSETAIAMGLSGAQGISGGTMGSTAAITNGQTLGTGTAPSNTVATGLVGLGGQFTIQPTMAANVDGIICSFQNPSPTVNVSGRPLVIDSISVSAVVAAALTGGGGIVVFGVAWGHNAVSLATTEGANTKAPRRKVLGYQNVATAAAANTVFASIPLTQFTDVVVQPGEYFQFVAKNMGTAFTGTSGLVTFLINVSSHYI